MADYYAATAKNLMLAELTVNKLSLHTGNPGADGSANEYSGGGYARRDATFAAAADGKRALTTTVMFSGTPEDTVTWVGFWSNTTFRGAKELPEAAEFHADTGMLAVLKDDTFYGIGSCP
jgi:hypothetical protein